ncbi:MAG: hypothetical protein IT372_10795 [Polyangiaceae bacterium]|nr:hypothetical protein [Polyangiaceae bacterium]
MERTLKNMVEAGNRPRPGKYQIAISLKPGAQQGRLVSASGLPDIRAMLNGKLPQGDCNLDWEWEIKE